MRETNQVVKRDKGKPELSLVPMKAMLTMIARVREFGTYTKGYERNSWREVEVERYVDSFARHAVAFIDNPHGRDEESGLPHLYHVACNVAFLCELMQNSFAEISINEEIISHVLNYVAKPTEQERNKDE